MFLTLRKRRTKRMNKSQGFVIALITALVGGGSLFTYSSVVTTNISDIDQNIFNELNLDIDVEELRELCRSGEIPEKYQSACSVLELLP